LARYKVSNVKQSGYKRATLNDGCSMNADEDGDAYVDIEDEDDDEDEYERRLDV